jgi:uncharacterized protein YndB with AHSA1/START domain
LKKTLLFLFYAVFGLFLVFIGGGYVLPERVHMERQTIINAPPEKVFAIVSDLQRAREWQPWQAMDPNMKVTFEGNGPGVGQKMIWQSDNPQVGSGSQTVTEFIPNEKLVAALDFGDMGKADATVTLAPEGSGTRVAWLFDAKLDSIIERWFGLLMERFVGPDFEKGLAALKAAAEKP